MVLVMKNILGVETFYCESFKAYITEKTCGARKLKARMIRKKDAFNSPTATGSPNMLTLNFQEFKICEGCKR